MKPKNKRKVSKRTKRDCKTREFSNTTKRPAMKETVLEKPILRDMKYIITGMREPKRLGKILIKIYE